jgi:plasmid stability protein
MKALHIRDVDALVIQRIGMLARLHRRSMQAELRVILEEAARKAQAIGVEDDDSLVMVAAEASARYGREDIYADDAR